MYMTQITPTGDSKMFNTNQTNTRGYCIRRKQVHERNLFCICYIAGLNVWCDAKEELEVNSVKIVNLLFLLDLEQFLVDTHDLFRLPVLCILSRTPILLLRKYTYTEYQADEEQHYSSLALKLISGRIFSLPFSYLIWILILF